MNEYGDGFPKRFVLSSSQNESKSLKNHALDVSLSKDNFPGAQTWQLAIYEGQYFLVCNRYAEVMCKTEVNLKLPKQSLEQRDPYGNLSVWVNAW